MTRLPLVFALAFSLSLVACRDQAASRVSDSLVAVRSRSLDSMHAEMRVADDSIGTLLDQAESDSLTQLDSGHVLLQSRVARGDSVHGRLATNAPNVYARLARLVEEHNRLRSRLAQLTDSLESLRERVRTLEQRNRALGSTVAGLRDENRRLRALVTRLVTDSTASARRIVQLDSSRTAILTRASRAYVTIASRDSLRHLGIAGKTNFLRLGETVLRRFDTLAFRRIDARIDTIFVIPVRPHRAQLLSTHPAGSYVLFEQGGGSTLRIVDVDAFWSASRMLAVMTNPD